MTALLRGQLRCINYFEPLISNFNSFSLHLSDEGDDGAQAAPAPTSGKKDSKKDAKAGKQPITPVAGDAGPPTEKP